MTKIFILFFFFFLFSHHHIIKTILTKPVGLLHSSGFSLKILLQLHLEVKQRTLNNHTKSFLIHTKGCKSKLSHAYTFSM